MQEVCVTKVNLSGCLEVTCSSKINLLFYILFVTLLYKLPVVSWNWAEAPVLGDAVVNGAGVWDVKQEELDDFEEVMKIR